MGEVKVLDFGIANFVNQQPHSQLQACTYSYSSPELWKNGSYDSTQYDKSNDLYSLGLIFYELFHMKRAFEEQPTTQKIQLSNDAKQAPPGFEELFVRWVHPQKSERYKTAQELINALKMLYSDDFNIKHEIQQEVLSLKAGEHQLPIGQKTYVHKPSQATLVTAQDNMWPLVASIVMILSAILSLEYYLNADKTKNLHEERVELIKKDSISREIASPTKESQSSR
jgi:serine/threonine protein kinase